ncbi:hypothetical protein PACTADRAFT_41543 [Pachysolen tannophilus NRRL Y-2460]|uniref:Fe2OG dioxygenase domain-containing protein n=1 Tax=Pachysolen tannophilus NRRL Y-2460 TaxID=669874 RepID=A0A1E4TX34_PACTA|nr:hypothetical protein PACTADRAFT_41543 [Pachysolen tannophilus NRRL Y-2460]
MVAKKAKLKVIPNRKNIEDKKYEFPLDLQKLSSKNLRNYDKPIVRTIVPDQIITIERFFTEQLCADLIKSFESSLELSLTPKIESKDYASRVNDRALVNDHETALNLWKYLKKVLSFKDEYDLGEEDSSVDMFDKAIGLNSQLRVYRYTKGHYFGKHYDDDVNSTVLDSTNDTNNKKILNGRTKWTMLMYLTGDEEFTGGNTIFYPATSNGVLVDLHPSKGMVLLHKHGQDCLLHEADLVKNGEKWVLRTDVVFE